MMLLHEYQVTDLRFAYCYHVYLRWSTHRRRTCQPLGDLDQAVIAELAAPLGIHILECGSSAQEVRLLVSLKPEESIATCASKLKGRVSRWLREKLRLEERTNLVSKGYFACTSGKSKSDILDKYLQQQGEHHGYAERALPPVYVEAYAPTEEQEANVKANHAFTSARFHVVLATWRRRGVFAAPEAAAVARRWSELQAALSFVLLKVSFVPDHVHLAVRVHPSVTPATLVVELMNGGQSVMFEQFPDAVIRAGVEKLWQPSAYIGSFGDLASPQIQAYVHNWQADSER
jgi:REP element-mobilizing transposase RayT